MNELVSKFSNRSLQDEGTTRAPLPPAGPPPVPVSVETYQQKLKEINNEIEQSLRSFASNLSAANNDIEVMRSQVDKSPTPQLEFCLRLFRRLMDEVNAVRLDRPTTFSSIFVSSSFSKDADNLGGAEAAKQPRFILRFAQGAFAFISFVIMACVPHIGAPEVNAKTLFDHDGDITICATDASSLDGAFSYVPYQAVLICGVLLWLDAIFMWVFYLSPVNAEGKKYCCKADKSESCMRRFQLKSKGVQMVLDVACLCASFAVGVYAAVSIEMSERFKMLGVSQFYSLPTFFDTYATGINRCIEEEHNPVSIMRASIAMIFFAFFMLLGLTQLSVRAYIEASQIKKVKGATNV